MTKKVLSSLVLVGMAAVFVTQPSVADQLSERSGEVETSDLTNGYALTNGYFIRNISDKPLTFVEAKHDGRYEKCDPMDEDGYVDFNTCVYFSHDFEVDPPLEIASGETLHFEIAIDSQDHGLSADKTAVKYWLGEEEVVLTADVRYWWILGNRLFREDLSSCSPVVDCTIIDGEKTTGKGTQTTFTVH